MAITIQRHTKSVCFMQAGTCAATNQRLGGPSPHTQRGCTGLGHNSFRYICGRSFDSRHLQHHNHGKRCWAGLPAQVYYQCMANRYPMAARKSKVLWRGSTTDPTHHHFKIGVVDKVRVYMCAAPASPLSHVVMLACHGIITMLALDVANCSSSSLAGDKDERS